MEVGRYTNSLRTDTTEDYKLLVFLFFGTILFSQPFFFLQKHEDICSCYNKKSLL